MSHIQRLGNQKYFNLQYRYYTIHISNILH